VRSPTRIPARSRRASASLTGRPGDFLHRQPPGTREWRYWHKGDRELMVLNFGIAWEDYRGRETRYTLAVAADTAPLLHEVQGFRTALWTWLGGLAVILLLAQGAILQWGLRPLRRVVEDLRRIEGGEAKRLEGQYPRELQGLTSNLNALIGNSRANQQRYRNSLDDLAHSMKTPLAILRNAAYEEGEANAFRSLVQEQVQRMDAIVQHQLRRAAASGRGTLGRVVQVPPLVERLTRSLGKVYRDKVVQVELGLSAEARFFGDEADLLEVLGNLVDNAFKYGRGRVRVSAVALPARHGPRPGLELCIEDDGPGIDPLRLDELMQRGLRLDEGVPGEGIGLSVAREIVDLYDGRIEAGRSGLGGARILVRWPPL